MRMFSLCPPGVIVDLLRTIEGGLGPDNPFVIFECQGNCPFGAIQPEDPLSFWTSAIGAESVTLDSMPPSVATQRLVLRPEASLRGRPRADVRRLHEMLQSQPTNQTLAPKAKTTESTDKSNLNRAASRQSERYVCCSSSVCLASPLSVEWRKE